MMKVLTIDELLTAAKHLLIVNDRIPPMMVGPRNVPLRNSVGMYRKLLRWKEEGVNYVIMTYQTDALVGFNQPYSQYYTGSARLLSPYTKMEPLKL